MRRRLLIASLSSSSPVFSVQMSTVFRIDLRRIPLFATNAFLNSECDKSISTQEATNVFDIPGIDTAAVSASIAASLMALRLLTRRPYLMNFTTIGVRDSSVHSPSSRCISHRQTFDRESDDRTQSGAATLFILVEKD